MDDEELVLQALYSLEGRRLSAGQFDGWTTPAEVAAALPEGHAQRGDALWTRAVLERLWLRRRVLQVPDASEGAEPPTLHDVVLRERDAYADADTRIPVEQNDCRLGDGYPWERAARYAADIPTRYRSRVAEVTRLLSLNFQRFGMAPATGLLRYERRSQVRPLYDVPLSRLADQVADAIQARRLPLDVADDATEVSLGSGVDRARLAAAVHAVLGALADDFAVRGAEAVVASFQARSILATMAGLYSPEYREQFAGHIVTAGVGSGKSYAFQLGALIHVAYEALCGRRKLQVLFLYPRVVLAVNQFQELFRLIDGVSKRLAKELSVPLASPVLDAGGQLPRQFFPDPRDQKETGARYKAIQQAYQERRQVLISNLDTVVNRLVHPEASQGLCRDLELVVLDEAHLLSGLYGAHAKMLLKRLCQLRALWRLRREHPDQLFEGILSRRGDVRAPYFIGASATISEPRQHLGRVLDVPPSRLRHVDIGEKVETGWIHHVFLRQRPEVSSMTAVTNAVSCLVHNRRDGLYHEYYQRRHGGDPLRLDEIPNPVQAQNGPVVPRATAHIHKTLGFSDSLDGVNRWADLVADNEQTKTSSMSNSPNPGMSSLPYFARFQEPLWRQLHQTAFPAEVPKWQETVARQYGELCRDCKRGVRREIARVPPGLRAAQQQAVRNLWRLDPDAKDSYAVYLHIGKDWLESEWFAPLHEAAAADRIGNLDQCGFLRAGLCWWWSRDHLGSNHPQPATGADPVNGFKRPCGAAEQVYHPLNAIRVRGFTSKVNLDVFAIDSINDVFRGPTSVMLRGNQSQLGNETQDNVAMVIGSPRIEVGIDLARVSDGVTYRAMRDPASLQQKVGRVGREAASDSVLVHVVTENARDHFYFRNTRIALDPDYLQPIPLHENNRIVARTHYFMAIVDFLCLQGDGPAQGQLTDLGHRLALINDHGLAKPFAGTWEKKVRAVYEFLFGNSPRAAQNLTNLARYLEGLGARPDDIAESRCNAQPQDAPLSRAAGAVDVFRHELGPNLLLTPLGAVGKQTTLAAICSWPDMTWGRVPTAGLPRHEEFLRSLPVDKAQRDRSYLYQILTLPLFLRGVPARNISGDQPFVWAPNLFEAAGTQHVRIFEERGGQLRDLDFEPLGLALALLVPGTVTYRYGANPRKIPVARFGARGLTELQPGLQAVRLEVADAEFYQPADCAPLAPADLPANYPWAGATVHVYRPRQIGTIWASSEPLVTPDGLLVDGDSAGFDTEAKFQVHTPPRCYPLRWFRIELAAIDAAPPPCRFAAGFDVPPGQAPLKPLPLPVILSPFSAIRYSRELDVTEFVWGLDRQFMSRDVRDPARLVYCDAEQNLAPAVLGRHFKTPGLQFDLDLGPASSTARFLTSVWEQPASPVHQAVLLKTLYGFLEEHARAPLPDDQPSWVDRKRPSLFVVRNLRTLVLAHLLERWHPAPKERRRPDAPFVLTFDDLAGCFTPGHPAFISPPRFRDLCARVAAVQNAASADLREDTLLACHPNFVGACDAIGALTSAFFRATAEELLLNTLGLTLHAAALRLTGAESGDLEYFYRRRDNVAALYLFDADEAGNGTTDLVQRTFYVSAAERVLDARRRALNLPTEALPTLDFADCLEDACQECESSQASQLAYQDAPATGPCLADLRNAREGERQSAGRVFDFLRDQVGLASMDHALALQQCPEFLMWLSRYPVYAGEPLVPSREVPNIQALESALGCCIDGCVACVVAPEQNLRGVLSARDTVSKLLLDAFYRTQVCEAGTPLAQVCYPGTGPGRTELWTDLAMRVASAVGQDAGEPPVVVRLNAASAPLDVTIMRAAVPAGWHRVFRPTWEPAGMPGPRVRPRMSL
ncbi:DEAD/DEAH box helicase [Sorangium cellulosum]|uniref:Helicase ATP-binding domain-containing protein n=1 Tax=Sorangium cellulosum TaxID=56 RepID=A0A150QS71_SORCE|nr:DEAD/DEAH box helicase family protein [Sorangium cellulosum]KYF70833.1 hypothetical protein BE15_30445 [Sorangium cellulosum]